MVGFVPLSEQQAYGHPCCFDSAIQPLNAGKRIVKEHEGVGKVLKVAQCNRGKAETRAPARELESVSVGKEEGALSVVVFVRPNMTR